MKHIPNIISITFFSCSNSFVKVNEAEFDGSGRPFNKKNKVFLMCADKTKKKLEFKSNSTLEIIVFKTSFKIYYEYECK